MRALGPLSVAVFNASAVRGPTLEITAEQFTQAWRTATLGGFLFARDALQALLANGVSAQSPQGAAA